MSLYLSCFPACKALLVLWGLCQLKNLRYCLASSSCNWAMLPVDVPLSLAPVPKSDSREMWWFICLSVKDRHKAFWGSIFKLNTWSRVVEATAAGSLVQGDCWHIHIYNYCWNLVWDMVIFLWITQSAGLELVSVYLNYIHSSASVSAYCTASLCRRAMRYAGFSGIHWKGFNFWFFFSPTAFMRTKFSLVLKKTNCFVAV